MTYVVNAWLERENPQLKVTDSVTGQVLIDWDADLVRELIERGEIDVGDFRRADQRLQSTVRDLFLLSCRREKGGAEPVKESSDIVADRPGRR